MWHLLRTGCLFFAGLLLAGCLPPAGGMRGIVKIGLVAPFSMAARGDGYSVVYAAKLALNEWNARGGVHGYRFELVSLDDNDDPATAAQRARELAVDSLVIGVVGHYGGDTTLAALPEYRKAGMPLVIPLAGTEEASGSDWQGTVRIAANDSLVATMLAAQNNGTWQARRIAIIHVDTPAYTSMRNTLNNALGASTIAMTEVVPALPDAAALDNTAQRVSASQPDLIIYIGNRPVGAEIATRLKAQLPKVQLVMLPATDMDAPEIVKLGGNALEDILYSALWADPASLSVERMYLFHQNFQKLAGGAPRSSAVLAYDGANVLFTAIERAVQRDGRPTRAGVLRELRQVTLGGLTGNHHFNERGESSAANAFLYRFVVARYPGEQVATRSK